MGEIPPVRPGLSLEGVVTSPVVAWSEPAALCPEAASVEVAPDPSHTNASTSPIQITVSGGIRNPDRQPPCEEKAVVWSEEGEACLEGMAPEIS